MTLVVALVLGATGIGIAIHGLDRYSSMTLDTANRKATNLSRSPLDTAAIAAQVTPATVDVTSSQGYQHATAAGTGVLLTSSGEVLTNNHVIEQATSIAVKVQKKRETFGAKVVGTDATDDIAVIQIEGASGLPTVKIGDSSKVSVGDPVIAIGNALDLAGPPTVTEGSITALGRSITAGGTADGAEQLTDLIQTDAQLQPGNSGGPLVNSSGQVIGVNTAASAAATTDAGSNVGFAIPINDAMSVVRQIESGNGGGNVQVGQSAFLGVDVQDVRSADNNSGEFGAGAYLGGSNAAPVSSGALVIGVERGSPAESSGLSSGDVIVSIDGQEVDGTASLTRKLAQHHPGDIVNVGFVDQNGQHHSASVSLTSGPAR